jgi:glycosyltransferase involved in cell wall biosynthesis
MWRNKTVSVILPTYNERESIRQSIREFFDTGFVDEIIVVNNNAAPGTSEEIAGTGAREVVERRQGYGYAIRRGLEEVSGDLIIIAEPDGTFMGNDTLKLLAYSDDFEVVFGTRTTSMLIWEGANMGWFLKWGNYVVAKMMEFLFNTTALTDVGCTMRLIHRGALQKIQHQLREGGSHFGVEMMCVVITNGLRFIEIPLNYRPRVGLSSVTGSKWKAFWLGWRMIFFILGHRLRTLGRAKRPIRPRVESPPSRATCQENAEAGFASNRPIL